MNKVILMGRLTADPELRTTPTGVSVTTIRIAVNRRFARQGDPVTADFFDVVCWRQTAEFVSRYFTKGRQIAVVGSLQTRSWTDQNGGKRYATEVVADEVYFADSKKDASASGAEAPYRSAPRDSQSDVGAPSGGYTPAQRGDFEEVDDGDELPF
ncbi:MAG: single-stranded DNA-binding protein [Clostridia bacterium]|nr:single-stranded DNA-binding protein [Clostridia bacterium]